MPPHCLIMQQWSTVFQCNTVDVDETRFETVNPDLLDCGSDELQGLDGGC